eukprot:g20428.t1
MPEEFIKLNDQVISINCQPPKVDCSEASNKLSDLFSCVEDMDVQLMFKRNNSLELIAKISDAVNKSDCAYKGKMLYAVPQVTCMVGNLTERVKSANSTGYERPSAQPMDLPGPKGSSLTGTTRPTRSRTNVAGVKKALRMTCFFATAATSFGELFTDGTMLDDLARILAEAVDHAESFPLNPLLSLEHPEDAQKSTVQELWNGSAVRDEIPWATTYKWRLASTS